MIGYSMYDFLLVKILKIGVLKLGLGRLEGRKSPVFVNASF